MDSGMLMRQFALKRLLCDARKRACHKGDRGRSSGNGFTECRRSQSTRINLVDDKKKGNIGKLTTRHGMLEQPLYGRT